MPARDFPPLSSSDSSVTGVQASLSLSRELWPCSEHVELCYSFSSSPVHSGQELKAGTDRGHFSPVKLPTPFTVGCDTLMLFMWNNRESDSQFLNTQTFSLAQDNVAFCPFWRADRGKAKKKIICINYKIC